MINPYNVVTFKNGACLNRGMEPILTQAEREMLSEPMFFEPSKQDRLQASRREMIFAQVTEGTVKSRQYWQSALDIGVATIPPTFRVDDDGAISLDYLAKVFAYSGVDIFLNAVAPFFLKRVFTVGHEDQATLLQEAGLPAVLTDIAVNQMWCADEVLAERLTDVALSYLTLEKDADPSIFAMGVGVYIVRQGLEQRTLTLACPGPLTLDSVLKYSSSNV